MNNLPTTFDDLLALLRKLRDECSWPENRSIDYDMFAARVDALLDQYEAQDDGGKK